jgi:hypothetical protein
LWHHALRSLGFPGFLTPHFAQSFSSPKLKRPPLQPCKMEEQKNQVQPSAPLPGNNTPDSEQGEKKATYIPQCDDEYNVTFKTWIVVSILSFSYGISFWIIPALSAAQTQVAASLGDASQKAFFLTIYTLTITIAFMVCGGKMKTSPSIPSGTLSTASLLISRRD